MIKNESQNVLENVLLLDKFVQKVWFESQTPSIIRLVSSNVDYMILCAAIVNNADSDAIALAYRQKGFDIHLLREKLIPVANALGLTNESVVSQDYYNILGLTPTAGTDEIKKAFRQKARTVHPDTNHSGESQSCAFVELNEAYQTLSNPESRRRYDQSYQNMGLWNEQSPQNQRPPRKFGYIYMIGGLALFFITAAFIFDYIFREEVLFDIPYTDERPPISTPKRITPSNNNAKDNPLLRSQTNPPNLPPNLIDSGFSKGSKTSETQVPTPLPVQKAPLAQYHFDSGKQTMPVKNTAKKSTAPLFHAPATQDSDAAKQSVLLKLNPDDQKRIKKKPSTIIGAIEYIDTEKNSALFPEKSVSPPPPIQIKSNNKHSEPVMRDDLRVNSILETDDVAVVPALSLPVLSQSDENDRQTLFRSAKYSVSSTPSTSLPEKDRVSVDHKEKIKNFLKTYCMTYEQKNLKKFATFFKSDAIENGKPFHTLLPQYRHNFATIASITYTIVMHQYSYLFDSTDIKMEGEFFIRWREYGANWKKNNGSVFMQLEHHKGSFLVKQLYYLGGEHKDTKTPSVDQAADQVSQNGLPALEKNVKIFLNNYCQTYQNKNLTKFASFFKPDATENGKPFHTMLPQYHHNFSTIDSMTYTIVIHRYSRLDAKTVRIDGAFSMQWHKYNKDWSKNRGSISMLLSEENNSFRVKELNYRGD